MFTGIIRDIGTIRNIESRSELKILSIETQLDTSSFDLGASIAINGVCLTLKSVAGKAMKFDAVRETLNKTTLGQLNIGSRVHLEPALRLSDGIDGHLVYGHIDGLGEVMSMNKTEGAFNLRFKVPNGFGRYLLEKGSIAIDGTSLTCYDVEGDLATVTLIPETVERTLLEEKRNGDPLNIEVDIIGKWMEKFIQKGHLPNTQSSLLDKLNQGGF